MTHLKNNKLEIGALVHRQDKKAIITPTYDGKPDGKILIGIVYDPQKNNGVYFGVVYDLFTKLLTEETVLNLFSKFNYKDSIPFQPYRNK